MALESAKTGESNTDFGDLVAIIQREQMRHMEAALDVEFVFGKPGQHIRREAWDAVFRLRYEGWNVLGALMRGLIEPEDLVFPGSVKPMKRALRLAEEGA